MSSDLLDTIYSNILEACSLDVKMIQEEEEGERWMVSGGSTPIGSRPASTFGNPLVFKPSAAALRKAIEKVEVSKIPKAVNDCHGIDDDDGGYDVVRPQGGPSMESGDSSRRVVEPMESGEPDYEELFYSAAEDVPTASMASPKQPRRSELSSEKSTVTAEEPVYAVPMKKKLRDKLINVIGGVGSSGGGGGSSSGGSSGDVSQDRTPLPTPRNGLAIHLLFWGPFNHYFAPTCKHFLKSTSNQY